MSEGQRNDPEAPFWYDGIKMSTQVNIGLYTILSQSIGKLYTFHTFYTFYTKVFTQYILYVCLYIDQVFCAFFIILRETIVAPSIYALGHFFIPLYHARGLHVSRAFSICPGGF